MAKLFTWIRFKIKLCSNYYFIHFESFIYAAHEIKFLHKKCNLKAVILNKKIPQNFEFEDRVLGHATVQNKNSTIV